MKHRYVYLVLIYCILFSIVAIVTAQEISGEGVDYYGNPTLQQLVSRNADWKPVKKRDPKGITMVLVPAGSFTMGSTEKQIDAALKLCNEVRADGKSCQRQWFEDEAPTSIKSFSEPFWIDETEVTRRAYQKCVDAGACTTPPDSDYSTTANQPINRLTWYQAAAYCKWRGVKLPTEAQWEYAARGPDGLVYPWGNSMAGSEANHCDSNCPNSDLSKDLTYKNTNNNDGFQREAPVGSYPHGASWVGALDMSGNVWEWTRSLYQSYSYNESSRNSLSGDEKDVRELIVFRGGSFDNISVILRATGRFRFDASVGDLNTGLRCVRSNSDF